MPDLAAILGALGVSALSVYQGVRTWRQRAVTRVANAETQQRAASRSEAVRRGLHVQALRELYPAGMLASSGLEPYSAWLGTHEIPTSVVGAPAQLRLHRRFPSDPFGAIREGAHRLRETRMPPLADDAAAYEERLKARKIEITNRPVYRLLEVDTEAPEWSWHFALDHYLHWHRDMGSLAEELWRALHETRNDVSQLLVRRRELLPQRLARLGSAAQLMDFTERITAGGPTITCAFRRREEGDFAIPVRTRHATLASGADMLGIIAQGMHQHAIDASKECSVVLTAWRELFEELFDGREVQGDDAHLRPGWFLRRGEALEWFSTHTGWQLYATGFGLDLTSGTFELALLLVVEDPDFFESHEAKFKTNWEFVADHAHSPFVGTRDTAELTNLLLAKHWASSSLYSFVRGLITLQRLHPDLVTLEHLRDTP